MTYEMQTKELDGVEGGFTAAYTIDGGHYIGDEGFAKLLEEKGIAPTVIEGHTVCSIGFCDAEQKWYGWSHRAMFGFGVGSEVKPGDCAYVPRNADDFLEQARAFWGDDEWKTDAHAEHAERDGESGVLVSWTYTDDVLNPAMRGQRGDHFSPYPAFGRGAWTALNLDDARQMAIDFADSVS